jgi:hypothetical protein
MLLLRLCEAAATSRMPPLRMTPRIARSWPPKGVKKHGAAVMVQATAQIRISWSYSWRIGASRSERRMG